MFQIQHKQSSWIQTKKPGQPYSETSPYNVSENSLEKDEANKKE